MAATCLSAVPLTGAADPADAPTNPIPAAINVAITILRIRFSFSVLLIRRAGDGERSKRREINAESPHRLVFALIEAR